MDFLFEGKTDWREVVDNQVLSVNFKNYTLWIGGRKLYVSRMVFKFAMEYFRYIN